MANTESAYEIGSTWVSINQLSGIRVGVSFVIQNLGLPGDYFIFAMHRDNGGAASVGITYEFAEAI